MNSPYVIFFCSFWCVLCFTLFTWIRSLHMWILNMLFTFVLILELFVTVFANCVIIGSFFSDLMKEFSFGFWFCFVMVLNAKFAVEMVINVVSIVVQHVPVGSQVMGMWTYKNPQMIQNIMVSNLLRVLLWGTCGHVDFSHVWHDNSLHLLCVHCTSLSKCWCMSAVTKSAAIISTKYFSCVQTLPSLED